MLSLYNNHHTLGVQCLVYGFAYLLGEAFLELKAMTEDIYHTWYLAQTCYHTIGDVCYVHTTIERKHMVLAKRIEIDVLYNYHLVTAFLVEDGTLKNYYGILLITSGEVSHGPGNTLWSL